MLSEKSCPRPGEAPRVPISLEGERRKAMKLIFRMERESENFREKWLLDVTDENTDEWVEYVNLVKNKTNKQFKSFKDFEKELIKLKDDRGYLGSRVAVISQLQKVCDRAKAFEDHYDMNYQRIDDALKQYMGKYCHSFFAELEDLDVDCVREYENSINEWQGEIRDCLTDAEKAMSNITELFDISFSEYISSYAHALRSMHIVLDSFLCVSDPFRSWVTADEGYITKVRIEIRYLERQKGVISEAARKNTFRVQETKAKGLQTSFKNKKLDEKVKGTIFNRQFCRKREFSFVDKIEMTENILHERNLELDEAMAKLHSRPQHTLVREPSDGMKDRTARLQHEVNRIEKRLNEMKRGKRDLRETRYNLQKEYHKLKGVYESSIKKARRQREDFQGQKQHVKDINDELRTVDKKIKALKRIIYVKNHPATVKKIYFDGYLPGEKIDYRGKVHLLTSLHEPPDTLREAIDVAAQGVGKDWDKMYQTLPFNPPRNPLLRSKDLDLMDMDFKSVHPPTEQMALRSLDKWTTLSKVTSVNALVRTLKTIKKAEVAKRIEKQVLTVVN